ncbi:acyltransferase family protein [Lentzea terrae]|uniref:acyltransferase family protein n=1 Tax=Lentzea terrae TaxID=2200761 RepID=UPI000DD39FF2|nr:acyltransferase family protein [Lentzea terrae]
MRPREDYLDWLRATSLIVVVLWHWAFTILRWTPDGPVPTSPLGFLSGLWILTWLLQVLPVFFYVGGCVHSHSWDRDRENGAGTYIWRHVRHLLLPSLALLGTWAVLGSFAGAVFGFPWMRGVVLLVISPLWFVGVYVVLITLVPLSSWLHRRFDVLVPVWLGGVAMLVDVLRFRYDLPWIGWVNMLVVWWLAHQAGFFHERLTRRTGWALLSGGLFGLAGLVFSGLYPGSMVGVPGDRLSNVGPPTFVLVALLAFQIGFAEVIRPLVEHLLRNDLARRIVTAVNAFALPLFLFHSTGMALARTFGYVVLARQISDDRAPDLIWWLQRPLAVLASLVFTLPLIALVGSRRRRP